MSMVTVTLIEDVDGDGNLDGDIDADGNTDVAED